MDNYILLYMIWLHWFSDFVLQSDEMAMNKSSSLRWLNLHCVIYGACFTTMGWGVGLGAYISHLLIDGISSKVTTWLHWRGERSLFFKVIGFDQALHLTVLWYFYNYYLGGV